VKWTKECGERLRETRKDRELSQDALARRLGLGYSAMNISRWERCSESASPTLAALTSLSAALDVKAPYLLCQTDDPHGENKPFDVAEQWEKEVGGVSTAADVAAYVRSQRRDLFAAAALTGLVARGQEPSTVGTTKMAWKYADAMLEDE
jgi:transcriptional regulator with XRE-family HTH domain